MPEANYLGSELIELLYPKTILGQLQPRNVPFRVKIPRVTTGASASWVGEGKAKPVSSASFDLVSLDFHKLAVLAVMSEELLRFGDPSVESTVRDILAEAIRQKVDTTFLSAAGVAGVSPPGIINGATSITSTGGTLAQIEADLLAVMTSFANQNIPLSSVVVVMNPRSKMYLGVLRTANDTLAFPEITANNTWRGMRIVDSNQVPIVGTAPALTSIVFIAESDILVARDPGIRVDSSREATIEMSSDPEADTGAMINLFQTNMVAILLEQAITWTKARTNSVIILASVPY
jgi:HK97 family phage major capsid protein